MLRAPSLPKASPTRFPLPGAQFSSPSPHGGVQGYYKTPPMFSCKAFINS